MDFTELYGLLRSLISFLIDLPKSEVYHQRFRVNRILMFIGALKLHIHIRNNFKAKAT